MFPLVNDTTELLIYYISDKFPILADDPQLPCDADNNPLIDPLRGDYFFVSLNNNVDGAEEYLSKCLNKYPKHEQYTFLNSFQTQSIGNLKIKTIEGEGTEDPLLDALLSA